MLNLLNFSADALKSRLERLQYVIIAALFGLAGFMPIILFGQAEAGTVTNRSLVIGTSEGSTATTYDVYFDVATTGNLGSVYIEFCTTAVGTCTTASDSMFDSVTLTVDEINSVDSNFSNGGSTLDNDAYAARASATSLTAGDTVHLQWTGVVNPPLSGNSVSFYGRITTYSATNFTGVVDTGSVAAAVTRQLTINGLVAERLDFCVGALDQNADGASDVTVGAFDNNAVCADGDFPTTTNVNLGVIDDSQVYLSPVTATATNQANDRFGVALVKTNASNGVDVSYFAEDAASVSGGDTDHLKAFRVVPTDCDATQTAGAGLVDQCFRSADGTSAPGITAGTEMFGMKIGCIDANDGTRSTTAALTVDTEYADSAETSSTDCEATPDLANSKFKWNESSTADSIASSTGVVDDEVIKLQYGATSSSTTPTGSYTVVSTYIATPTF